MTNMDYYCGTFLEFLNRYASCLETAQNVALQVNSANSSFCFFDSCQPKQNLIFKVQLNNESDSLVTDSVINRYLQYYLTKRQTNQTLLQHFMKFVGSFKVPVEKHSLHIPSGNEVKLGKLVALNLLARPNTFVPCVVIERIPNPIPLSKVNKLQYFHINALTALFKSLIILGNEIGFSHHDLHSGNILMNQDTQTFVLIDYGRSHIPKPDGSDFTTYNKIINSDSLNHPIKYNVNNPPWPGIPKVYDKYKGMYILSDIGGLCLVMLNDFFPEAKKQALMEKISMMLEIIGKTQTQTKIQLHMNIELPNDVLSNILLIGLTWLTYLENTFKGKIKETVFAKKIELLYKNPYNVLVKPEPFRLIEKEAKDFYLYKYKTFVDVWMKNIKPMDPVKTLGGGSRNMITPVDEVKVYENLFKQIKQNEEWLQQGEANAEKEAEDIKILEDILGLNPKPKPKQSQVVKSGK